MKFTTLLVLIAGLLASSGTTVQAKERGIRISSAWRLELPHNISSNLSDRQLADVKTIQAVPAQVVAVNADVYAMDRGGQVAGIQLLSGTQLVRMASSESDVFCTWNFGAKLRLKPLRPNTEGKGRLLCAVDSDGDGILDGVYHVLSIYRPLLVVGSLGVLDPDESINITPINSDVSYSIVNKPDPIFSNAVRIGIWANGSSGTCSGYLFISGYGDVWSNKKIDSCGRGEDSVIYGWVIKVTGNADGSSTLEFDPSRQTEPFLLN